MNLLELFDKGYEIMASVPTKDDAYDATEYYMNSGYYTSYVIAPYKRKPGEEDAYAVLLLC